MGTITFEGDRPFELITKRLPTAMSEGETVVLTLPVSFGGFPDQVAEIRVRLMLEHAEQLAVQIQPAIQKAQALKNW